ncbi:MAG: UDP-N-acetylmuramoyl-L-alanine--D-glutamate ligase [Desulfobulbaceae bacterium A2]|nr:MAG: UDP-N-acetylmuramoyl-L-alanine--D-glutamate ligase [Desulfobulbaceae bacterium A2]
MQVCPGKHALVLGLGKSGLAAARFLLSRGLRVTVSDSRPAAALDPAALAELRQAGVALDLGRHDLGLLAEVDLLLPSPGVPLDLPLLRQGRDKGLPITGELALAAPLLHEEVVAITGTNGKTTVTSLLGELCAAAGRRVFVGGNIGVPLLDYVLGPRQAEVLVLELSSFQLELAGDFHPRVALLLNLSPDHLDRHHDMAGYAAAKARIFTHQGAGDTAILNDDDPLVASMALPTGLRRLGFGRGAASQARLDGSRVHLRWAGEEEVYDLAATRLASSVNVANAAAAILAARSLGCDPSALRPALAAYVPQPHRLELVARIDGVDYVNDSKATNIGATCAALEAMAGPVLLIAGGRDKGGDYALMAPAVQARVRRLYLLGEAAAAMAAALGHLASCELVASLPEAVQRAAECARPGETVLLAPACASFDMFQSYGHRGQVFRDAVGAWGQVRGAHHG